MAAIFKEEKFKTAIGVQGQVTSKKDMRRTTTAVLYTWPANAFLFSYRDRFANRATDWR